ncbi:MAG: hypothetical protein AMJ69_00515 [Gammaproteobacteria bacterium SG8_47]|nr:MAG: hypothetical protein AMJ69_00515 [Gammaproteobacteria bacterium SG8_47]
MTEPRSVSIGRGWGWLSEAFGLFATSWGIWIVNILIFGVLIILLSLIPVVGALVTSLLSPVFLAGFMLGCRAIDDGGKLEVAHLFAGFSRNTGTLVGVGALYLVATLVAMVVTFGLMMLLGADLATLGQDVGGMPGQGPEGSPLVPLLVVLVVIALFIPVMMAYWFAPVLVVLHDRGVIESMVLSFKGCLRNILPFLVYGIIAFVLLLLASIPLMLGLLVMMPVLIASIYTAYRDIYLS